MKTVIYLCNTYIATIEELQKTIEDNCLGRAGKPFRKELVALLMDGILEEWLIEHDCEEKASHLLRLKETNETSDNKIFKEVYHILLGKECTADLDSAFSSIAELVYCEVDGTEITIKNNKIFLSESTKEIKFVYKALEEIDSKVCFELTKLKSKPKHWTIDNKMALCSKGGEFSISFPFHVMGKSREGSYVWDFISDHKERLYEMIIYGNQRQIPLNHGGQLTLYRLNDEKHAFWVTNGFPVVGGPIWGPPPQVSFRRNSKYEELARDELEKLNNTVSPEYKFRFGTYEEMRSLLRQVNDDGYIVPCIDKNRNVLFLDSFDNLKVNPNGSPQFCAVLVE